MAENSNNPKNLNLQNKVLITAYKAIKDNGNRHSINGL